MVDQHEIGVRRGGGRLDLIRLAGADEKTRVRTIAPPANAGNGNRARRARELFEFLEVFGIGRCAYPQAHEYGTLTCAWSLEQFGISRRLRTTVRAAKSLAGDRLDRRSVFVGDAHVARRDNC